MSDLTTEELAKRVEKRGYGTECSATPSTPIGDITPDADGADADLCEYVRSAAENIDLPYGEGVYGGFRGKIKNLLKTNLTFLLMPMVRRQSTYNSNAARAINELRLTVAEQRRQIEALKREVEELRAGGGRG